MEEQKMEQVIVMDLSLEVQTVGTDNNGNQVQASLPMAAIIKHHLDRVVSFTTSKQLFNFYEKLEAVLTSDKGPEEYTLTDFSVSFQVFRQLALREKVVFLEMIESLNKEFDFLEFETNYRVS